MKLKLKVALILYSIAILLFAGCKSKSVIEEKVNTLLKQLTLDEKVSMIHGSGKFTNGGVPRLGIPELRMDDGPCGVRPEVSRATWDELKWTNDNGAYFPAQTALAATWDTALARQFGKALGEESKIRGKHIQLAPGINIIRSPLGGRNWEYMSEDPFLISKLVVPVIEGIQSNGVAACVKHYALNNQETERGTINVLADERTLREIYLPGFQAAITEANSLSIMGAYNKYMGQYATYNKHLIMDILKGEWGFQGVVISDWNACHSTTEAVKYGLDIEMGTDFEKDLDFNRYFMANPLLDSIKAGKIMETEIDDKVRRILRTVLKVNALNKPAFDTTGMYAKLATPERVAVAKKVAEESIVLLKNNENALPLNVPKIKSIAVIGDNATRKHSYGGGSTIIRARYEVTPLEALKKKLEGKVQINYARGYEAPDLRWAFDPTMKITNEKLLQEAVETAKKSEIVLFFGGLNHNMGMDAEGADRADMSLPYGQDKLISEIVKANPKTIVVLLSGNPLELGEWYENVPALLHTSYLGMEAGNAIYSVLFGDKNPSGKLTMTFPKKLEDSPAHSQGEFPGTGGNVNYREGLFVGYRYFDTKNVEPMFPFGYGLSYTTFTYAKTQLPAEIKSNDNQIEVSFELTNSGKVEGTEISQVYIRQVSCSYERPLKELKGFSKTDLKAGESKKVIVKLDKKAFQFFDPVKKQWVIEPGKFEILIGSSSKDIKLKGETKVL